ncbi:MAG: HEAT repeat domain-containing protein [Leptolyngbyaceae cyanobacterium]
MSFLIGLAVGLALGATVTYFLTSKKAVTQSAKVQDLQRQLALAESEYERQLREVSAQRQPTPSSQGLASSAHPPKTSRMSIGQPSSPESSKAVPAPPTEPVVTNPTPITATAAAPIPQTTAQPSSTPKPPTPTPTTSQKSRSSTGVNDPNVVLAASYSPDAAKRREVAEVIGLTLEKSGKSAQTRWLPILTRLTRDPDAQVRLSAVQALAPVSPAKRLPLLRQALRDADPTVVEAASALINQSRGRSRPPQPKAKKRRLPKNR